MPTPAAFRPNDFEAVLGYIREGKSLRSACKLVGIAPERVREWIQDENRAAQYARAKDESADVLAEEIVELADIAAKDWLRPEEIQAARLQVDARKWVASKLKPRKYGDRQTLEHEGSINLGFADALKAARERVIDDQL